jgi:hypothetical protein
MGFFDTLRDASVQKDLITTAVSINDLILSIVKAVEPYENLPYLPTAVKLQVSNYVNSIDRKVKDMESRMQDMKSTNIMFVKVPCADGSSIAVPGYVIATQQMVLAMRQEYGLL